MGRVIVIVNQKGGVGKTTTAINLGACLAQRGKKVLIVDTDPQGNAGTGLGVIPEEGKTIYEVLIGKLPIEDSVVETEYANLYVIPSNVNLVGAEIELASELHREHVLEGHLQKIKDKFDYILLDSPPSLGLITVNNLTAADSVIIPLQCEYYALDGLSKLLNTIKLVKDVLNPDLRIEGVLMTMYDSRTRLSRRMVADVREALGTRVFDTVIPRTVKLAEAPDYGRPIIHYMPSHKGSEAYQDLADELLMRLEEAVPWELPEIPESFAHIEEKLTRLEEEARVMEEAGAEIGPTTEEGGVVAEVETQAEAHVGPESVIDMPEASEPIQTEIDETPIEEGPTEEISEIIVSEKGVPEEEGVLPPEEKMAVEEPATEAEAPLEASEMEVTPERRLLEKELDTLMKEVDTLSSKIELIQEMEWEDKMVEEGVPDEKTRRREYFQDLEVLQEQGYNVDRLKEALKGDLRAFEVKYGEFLDRVAEAEKLKDRLDAISLPEFDRVKETILHLLADVENIDQAKIQVEQLEQMVELSDYKRRMEEWESEGYSVRVLKKVLDSGNIEKIEKNFKIFESRVEKMKKIERAISKIKRPEVMEDIERLRPLLKDVTRFTEIREIFKNIMKKVKRG